VSESDTRLAAVGGPRFGGYVKKLVAQLTTSPGKLAPETRRAILERNTKAIPPGLTPYVIKVALHAYKVTDEDIIQLKRDGLDEDQIFEATASAAVGAALLRLEKGMAALAAAPGKSA
jgi:threonine synthase